MKIIYILLPILISTTACENKYRKAADEIADKSPQSANMNVGEQNYNLYTPEGWTSKHRTVNGVDYYFLSAPKTEQDPNTNINLISEYMQKLSLNEYKTKTIESLTKAIPTASILGQGIIKANGITGVWYSYSMQPQGIKATLISYIFPKDGIAYIITAGTQDKDMPRYRSLFDSVAHSLKFEENSQAVKSIEATHDTLNAN